MIFYYLFVNILTFILYGMDKRKARRHEWRISERTLLTFAFLGGGIGAYLGMVIFRHKTKHRSFRFLVPLAILIHLFLFGYLYLFPPFVVNPKSWTLD